MLLIVVWSLPPVSGRLPSHSGSQAPLERMNAIVNHLTPVAVMIVRGSGRAPQPRYAYGAAPIAGLRGGGVVGGLVGPPVGTVHFWLAPPVHDQICSGVPSAEDGPVASRHLPDAGLMSWPALTIHCWAPVPLQSYSWTLVPLAVPAAVTSIHLPSAWMLPLSASVHCWAFVPLHVYSWILVPLAVLAPATSTHLPP